ncbi:AraC-type DNA-binding protein [Mucilaginibacter lappiensis]|uniref:AraC-like DNA-binding protein n=1 Tax=Mucilaginibacter lappiensis TaxID=354630 RepID=A0ABR6PD14_9SPHI|nr:AraC family transcriptional regulator [Mucilaginibacter lappiensis]MBB6107645.1 AraC-like DNA-binding protein [Mucilaginibacter lappiensis]SIQ01823.1 AraC-type DNA-binding protein [Mucilaginibacter lappiensis]
MQKNYFKYLNVSLLEERWGMYVTSVGYSKVDPKDTYPNEEHPQSHKLTWNRGRILNDFYIIFISKGKGVYGVALTDPFEVAAGTCFFLYPGVLHRYKPDSKVGWEEYWVGFNGSYVEKLMAADFFDRQKPFVFLGPNKDVLILFRGLIEAVQTSLPGYHQQIAGITMQILGLINNISQHHENINDRAGKLIAKAKYIIQESFEDNLDMEKLAKELPMGYSSFRKLFKKTTGESPNHYHLNLRLERAKNLLTTTILNITEVAEHTGFESVFYFSKLFKKKNGVSPKFYRINEENVTDKENLHVTKRSK